MMRVLILIGFLCGASGVLADDALWARIAQGGYVLLIRHAATEAGTGDPSGFRIGDCATQRNLSAAGREEARRLGETFRAHGVPVAEVRSSPWCRCLDTARLAFGRAIAWAPLSSLFHDTRNEAGQRAAVIAYLRGAPAGGNVVLVTHNFNIRSLVGISPPPGETVVARFAGGKLELLGHLPVATGTSPGSATVLQTGLSFIRKGCCGNEQLPVDAFFIN
mgnify:FL=1